jgi:hypothetical protein
MMKHWICACCSLHVLGLLILVLPLAGCGGPAQSLESQEVSRQVTSRDRPAGAAQPSESRAPTGETQGATNGITAMRQAAEASKYLFAFFWKTEDEQTTAMRAVFEQAVNKAGDRADGVAVNITDPAQKEIVDKFDLERAPMPLVLAIAPNGAITGGFPTEFNEEALLEAFATPCTEQCMKCLQDGKLVFLCVQKERTQFNQAAWEGAQGFKADPRFAQATEVVHLNPSDGQEASFLQTLQVDPRTPQAVTVLLAPPGQPVARFTGAVTKDQIIAKATAGPCASGQCGPGGCGPKK